ncbi:MAG: isochorismatase family protein [Burkholderiales bacterium]
MNPWDGISSEEEQRAYNAAGFGRLAQKVPAIMNISEKGYEFPPEIAPREGDVLIPKEHPSAFFATPLVSHHIDLKADTLVVTGCTTSCCVRAVFDRTVLMCDHKIETA